jgi:transposase
MLEVATHPSPPGREALLSEAYDGREVAGMDLHRRRSVLVRMTADGSKLETARISNSPAELRRQIARAGVSPRVVVEATYGWYWAADTLTAAGAEVHLAHPLGVKGFAYRRVKNDERDAADLADLLRMGRLPEAWIAPPEIRELREITRYRHQLVKARTSVKDQVHGVLAKLGIPVTHSDIFGVHGQAWLDELPMPQPYAGKVASLRQLAGDLAGEITLLDTVLADLLAGHEGYAAIQQLPGIGPVLAAVIVAEIGDIRRFPGPRAAGLLGRADPPALRVRHQGDPRARHQAGQPDAALGGHRGHPAAARRDPPAAGQGRHHRPPRQGGQEHRQGRRRPGAADPGLLRDARRARPPCSPARAGRMTCPGLRPGARPPFILPPAPRRRGRPCD